MLYPIKPIDPSPSHRFLAMLEQKKLLLRVYTQNIDGLEEKAGVSSKKIVYAHGTLSTSTCLKCGHKVSADLLREDILKGDIPYCRRIINKSRKRKRKEDKEANNQSSDCGTNEVVVSSLSIMPRRARLSPTNNSCESQSYDEDKNIRTCGGVMKPNITFFGEQLIDRVRKCLEADRKKADAVIVIGTSLSVAPMSKIIEYLSPSIPRILINQNIVIPKHGSYCEDGRKRSDVEIDYHDEDNNYVKDHRSDFVFDACLLGFCDEVTTSLFALMSESNEDNKSKLRSLSSSQEDCCNFRVLCNIPSLVERLKVQTLFRHPLDRIFLYPGAILSKYDDDKNDDDESKEIKFQEIVHCDGCHQVIKKVIMKCTDCFDFDLCQDCFVTISKVHFEGNHKFIAEE